MAASYIPISLEQLASASLFMLVNVGLSFVLRLGLTQSLLVASLRMVTQLLLVGYVLQWVFTLQNPILVLFIALIMTAIAGFSSVNRTRRHFANIHWSNFVSLLAASFVVTGLTVNGIIHVEPWYDPQYQIPMLGMVLGNAHRFTEDLTTRREQIETLLSLGATRWEAAHPSVKEALRTGMIPTINSMMVMGLVSLPGMMTGQILAGASLTDAVRYQIVIIFTQASGTAIATIGVVLLAFLALFNQQHQLTLTTRKLG